MCADQTTCTANSYGGTSFAAPLWAGYLALVNQQAMANGNKALGFINPSLYTIGAGSSYDTDFHDITSGSNGYSATTGYDLVTGWGSPNGANLLNALAGTVHNPGFSLSASPSSVSVVQGDQQERLTITSTVSGGFNSAVHLTASGVPTGVTVGFNPTSITGAGTSTMSITVASTTATGTYTITVTGTSERHGGNYNGLAYGHRSGNAGLHHLRFAQFGILEPGIERIRHGDHRGLRRALTRRLRFPASGLPTGLTGSFSPTSIKAPGSGTSRYTLTAARTTKTGTYPITITGTGGGITHTTTLL